VIKKGTSEPSIIADQLHRDHRSVLTTPVLDADHARTMMPGAPRGRRGRSETMGQYSPGQRRYPCWDHASPQGCPKRDECNYQHIGAPGSEEAIENAKRSQHNFHAARNMLPTNARPPAQPFSYNANSDGAAPAGAPSQPPFLAQRSQSSAMTQNRFRSQSNVRASIAPTVAVNQPLSALNPSDIKNPSLRLEATTALAFAELVFSRAAVDLYIKTCETLFDELALVLDPASGKYRPPDPKVPYRPAICLYGECFKHFSSSKGLYDHCIKSHKAAICHDKFYQDDDGSMREHPDLLSPAPPNFTGNMCSLSGVLAMFSEAWDEIETSETKITRTYGASKTELWECPLSGALHDKDLHNTMRVADILTQQSNGQWSAFTPQSVNFTIRSLHAQFGRRLAGLSCQSVQSCPGGCGGTVMEHNTVITLQHTSLAKLSSFPVGQPVKRPTVVCSTCNVPTEAQFRLLGTDGSATRALVVYCKQGLSSIDSEVHFGEVSHGFRFEVGAVLVRKQDAGQSTPHVVAYLRDSDASSGWYRFDGAHTEVDEAPVAHEITHVLLLPPAPEANDEDDEHNAAAAPTDPFTFTMEDDDPAGSDPHAPPHHGAPPDTTPPPEPLLAHDASDSGDEPDTASDGAPSQHDTSPPFSLHIAVHNVHSATKRISEIVDSTGSSDLVFLSEVWQPSKTALRIFDRHPHSVFIRPRHGGGAAIIVGSASATVIAEATGVSSNVEWAAMRVQLPQFDSPIAIAAIYAPPDVPCNFRNAIPAISAALGGYELDIIAGDFNARHASWDPSPRGTSASWARGTHVHDVLHGRYSPQTAPTMPSGACIDIAFIKQPLLTGRSATAHARASTSDHDALTIAISETPTTQWRTAHRTRRIKPHELTTAQKGHFVAVIDKFCEGPGYADATKEGRRLEHVLDMAAQITLPGGKPLRPTAPPRSATALVSKTAARSPFRALKLLRRKGGAKCTLAAPALASAFAAPHLKHAGLPQDTVDTTRPNPNDDIPPISEEEMRLALRQVRSTASADAALILPIMLRLAASSSNFVRRLTALANATLRGAWPKLWSDATVTPVHKAGKPPQSTAGWRPISVLSWLLRVVEKAIKRRILSVVELDPRANGFRKGLATDFVTSAIASIDHVPGKSKWAVVAFDFSSAFPSLPHSLVLDALRKQNVPAYLIHWVVRYLTSRRIRVRTSTSMSDWTDITCGQAQGGLLGPLLWVISSAGALAALDRVASQRRPFLRAAVAAGYADDTSAAFAALTDKDVINAVAAAVLCVNQWALAHGIDVSSKTRIACNFDWPQTRPLVCAGRDIAAACHDANDPQNYVNVLGLRIDGKRGGGMRFAAHVDACIEAFWAEATLLMAIRDWVHISVLRQLYSSICLPQLARHLPAIARTPDHIIALDRAHAQGLKAIFGIHENTRNVTTCLELGFPTIAELQLTRAAVTATALQYRPDLAISGPACTTARATGAVPGDLRADTQNDTRHDPPPADIAFTGTHVPQVQFLGPSTHSTSPSDNEKRTHNIAAFRAAKRSDHIICTDGSRLNPCPEGATGVGSAAIALTRDETGKYYVARTWKASASANSSMFTAEGFALTDGVAALARELRPGSTLTILTDSWAVVQAFRAGPQMAKSFIESDFWDIAAELANRGIQTTVQFVFSHVSTCANSPRLVGQLVAATDLVDNLAKEAAGALQPTVLSRGEDRVRHAKHEARAAQRAVCLARSLRGRTQVSARSSWARPTRLGNAPLRTLLQARCGLSSAVGGHLHGPATDKCPRCPALVPNGHDAFVEHLFACPGTAQLRADAGIASLEALWTHPVEASRLIAAFRSP
jgi:hypothetical protein